MNIEYTVQIGWSDEDQLYIAMPAELMGCMADGKTQEEALANLRVVIKEWIEVATEEGREIPKPLSVQDFARLQEQAMLQQQKRVQQYIQKQVENAVSQVVEKFIQQQQLGTWGRFNAGGFFPQSEELEIAGRNG